ncbi:2-aminomuconic semialdehyde dehydrogenase-like isoform X2 [Carassius gibelio]|uniref:2-aminomuconic semialdehyde dehydrogenase-like isoform X2 n=1 Tax=Carassius gibelio TaxID=101364 RepID=UPI0022796D34|nr:2-aminomuconic semialdehyde dehydrogenase-like isoform X2 [Carassius gibelio]
MAAHCSRERSVCVPAESFYLTRIARFIETAHPWKTGVPSDPSNDSGALIRKEHLQKVLGISLVNPVLMKLMKLELRMGSRKSSLPDLH